MLISEEWRRLNAQLHEDCPEFGSKLHKPRIRRLKRWAWELGARDILDYGCGKGTLIAQSGFRFQVRGYDPAIPEYAERPAPADLVACWDVLEHIEPECLEAVLDDIRGLAPAAHIIVATRPDEGKCMPDGRNPHLIVEPAEWWVPRLRERWPVFRGRFDEGEVEFLGQRS